MLAAHHRKLQEQEAEESQPLESDSQQETPQHLVNQMMAMPAVSLLINIALIWLPYMLPIRREIILFKDFCVCTNKMLFIRIICVCTADNLSNLLIILTI